MSSRRSARSRRVLVIVQNLPLPLDRRVWLECRALVEAGIGVSVICPKGPGDPSFEELEGVRLYKYRPPPEARGFAGYVVEFAYCWLMTAWLAMKVLVRDGFAVVQACNPPDTYFALAWPLKLLGKRFVFDQHDLCPELYESRFSHPSRLLLGALRLLERLTYRTADHVIVTNESYRRVAMERGGLPAGSVTVVRTGPDDELLRAGEPEPELRRGRRFLVCYLGVMGPQDGVDLALRAADVLVHDLGRSDTSFTFVGDGDSAADLRRLAAELGLGDFVEFTGRVSDEELFSILSTADVGLSPDPKNPLNDVSTMNKTMEYMAFGVPVVAFALKETEVSAGSAGVYVPPNDERLYAKAIAEVLDDPDGRAVMGTAGRKRVEEVLAWKHQRHAYVGVYERLLAA